MSAIAPLREQARAFNRELEAKASWITVSQLAQRWGVCHSTVRDIPRDQLPFIEFGTGARYRRRRYDPADVQAFEATSKSLTSRAA
jgi:hypothetical protein